MGGIELVPAVTHAFGIAHGGHSLGGSLLAQVIHPRVRAIRLSKDPTREYFAGTDRDRAAFEAGIKLGSILHQYVGTPLTEGTARDLERTIEAGTRVQPLVEDVRVRIDRKRLRARGPYGYASLSEDLLHAEVTVRVGRTRAVGVLRYISDLDYPLMYLKEIGGPTNP